MRPHSILLITLLATPALACPVCDSDRGAQVRAGVIDEVSSRTAAALALPFVMVAGVISAVHFVPVRRKS